MELEKGPIFQDNNFVFTEFNGLKLLELVVCEIPETKEPLIVYIKIENHNFYQYFLDAGIGFWQNWNIIDKDEDDSYNYIDKTHEFDLFGKIISKIWCEPQKNNSQIIIAFEEGKKLILRTVNPDIFDSECELILIK